MPLLEAREVAVVPPGAPAPVLEGWSLAVEPGEWVALTGPNGGGKTSAALALGGLWPVHAGSVCYEGRPFGPGARRERVACVLQDPSVQLVQPTVAEELGFALVNLGADRETVGHAVAETAARFDLTHELACDPRTLSAGRQQRVLLAAALVSAPRVLIADEPGAHLDREARVELLERVAAEVARGLAVVWVTQDAAETARAARVVPIGARPEAGAANGAATPAGGVAAEVRVTPGDGDGPRVRVAVPRTFEIAARGVTAIVGPNAVGKSVLLATLGGLERPAGLEIVWRVASDLPATMALQYPEQQVFEERVEDELIYAACQRGLARAAARARALEALGTLGLPPATFERRTWDLSTGEKRLIEVTAALIAPAGRVLLDEPTAGLDPGRRAALARLVAARAGAAGSEAAPIVVATQDREWARSLGARIVDLGADPGPSGR